MHICFLTASMVGGGTERVIAILANNFVKQHEVSILLTSDNRVEYELDSNIEVIQLGEATGGNLKARIERIKKLRAYMREHKATRYLSFGTETNLFAIVSAFGLKRNLVVSERNDPNQCSFTILRNFLYRFAPKFVFQTEDARACFSAKIQKRGIVISNPVSDNLPQQYDGVRQKRIVAVGRLEPQKNHKLLLDAFKEFKKRARDYCLIIYGKGDLKDELEQYAIQLHIDKDVCFAGFERDVLEKIKDSSMYVLSSDYEGISNSLLEAMAIGLPVISTDCPIGGSNMVIKNNENGILIPVGDEKALAEAMIKIADNSEFAHKIAQNAMKVREEYSVKSIIGKWNALLD